MSSPFPTGSVVAVAHDAGGARALIPVIAELKALGWPVIGLAAGPAISLWATECSFSHVHPSEDSATTQEIGDLLAEWGCLVLLSAAGLYNQLEHTARLAARSQQLPVVALLDSWFNYRARFERSQAGTLSFSPPDKVCAIDRLTQLELQKVGFQEVILTGHPDMEQTVRQLREQPPGAANRWRQKERIPADSLLVTFFSDPFFTGPNHARYCGPGAIMKQDGHGLYGYTVEDVLPVFLQELERALGQAGVTKAELVIRPHPSEHEEVLQNILSQAELTHLQARITRNGSTLDWITASDAVVGMMTIALLHGALAGKPSISLEPGLANSGEPDPCMANTLGYTLGVFEAKGIPSICSRIVARDWASLKTVPKHELPLEGAARRVAAVVTSFLS